MDRRSFLQQSTSTVAGIARAGAARAAESDKKEKKNANAMQPIVDTHVASLGPHEVQAPLAQARHAVQSQLRRGRLSEGHGRAERRQGVYMEVDVEPSQQPAEAEYVIDLCKAARRLSSPAVISGRPAFRRNSPNTSGQYKGSPYIKGVRQVLNNPARRRVSACSRSSSMGPPAGRDWA